MRVRKKWLAAASAAVLTVLAVLPFAPNVNAAEEQGSGASGDIVIALESLTGDVYGYSSANTTAAAGNPVSVSGSAYGQIPAGTELVLRNRSGRTIALHAAATPNGDYAGGITVIKA